MRFLKSVPARIVLVGAVLLLLAGCETLGYYTQSVGGQLEVLNKRRPIAEVVNDEAVDPKVRTILENIAVMRQFAVDELGLPDNKSYTYYTDLGRRHVVWNVFAAPEFSVAPMQWCFPVVGCVVYRGYFDEADAEAYANKLKDKGIDTLVAGINAYSTLGWFADPVLNTFLSYPEESLAGLVFHELTHQQIYVKDDSMFNESLATAVELEGIKRWMKKNNRDVDDSVTRDRLSRRDDVTKLLIETRENLKTIYAMNMEDDNKRRAKGVAFEDMREAYQALKSKWGGYDGYDAWFARDFNNAYLISAATYRSRVPAFEALLERSDGDMAVFWREARALADMKMEERNKALDALQAGKP